MQLNKFILFVLLYGTLQFANAQNNKRARDYGIKIGIIPTGKLNSITDVQGVKVGHTTLIITDSIRTGVTAIVPHSSNLFQQKVPAAVFAGNGFGKLTGTTQIIELGNLETPIILTNTLSVAAGIEGIVDYSLALKGNENVKSVNAVVGETNDSFLNDIRGRHVSKLHVLQAIKMQNQDKLKKEMWVRIASNGSGDYMIAFSTDSTLRILHSSRTKTLASTVLHNDETSPIFMAAIEATEEAIINSLFAAKNMIGIKGNTINALPLEKVLPLLKKYNRIKNE